MVNNKDEEEGVDFEAASAEEEVHVHHSSDDGVHVLPSDNTSDRLGVSSTPPTETVGDTMSAMALSATPSNADEDQRSVPELMACITEADQSHVRAAERLSRLLEEHTNGKGQKLRKQNASWLH